jgi:DsbC/DsbD-like thiol-disulfide interchange protein
MRRQTIFSFVVILLALAAGARTQSTLPRPDTIVKPQAYVSLEPVPRGRAFEIAVVAEIMDGFHINANKVLQEYVIPTTLEAELPKGFQLIETVYPQGKLWKFDFSPERLNVYEGKITLLLKLQAQADAPLGTLKLPLRLRYQACNDSVCLPPVRKSVDVEFEVAAAGAKAQPAHSNIFSPAKSRP